MSDEREVWLPIPGFPGYEASNSGGIRSYFRSSSKTLAVEPHGLRPKTDHRGYLAVTLYRERRRAHRTVHSLVALTFVGPRPDGMDVNHIDADKTNARASNLEYVTRRDNIRHAASLGLMPTGRRNWNCKIGPENAAVIKRELANGVSQRALARRFGVSQGAIQNIIKGIAWRYVAAAAAAWLVLSSPAAADWYTEGTPTPLKADAKPLPAGANSAKFIRAEDWNNFVKSPTEQLRTKVKGLESSVSNIVLGNPNANDVAVTATGSTTARALKDRAADVVNVKDYGAKGDGSDDTAAFSAALAAGLNIYVPAGVYRTGQIVLRTGQRLVGAGRYATEIRPTDNNASVILIDRDAGVTTGYAVEVSGLRINGYDTGTGHGIEATAANLGAVGMRLHDLRIEHVGGDGIHLESVWSSRIDDVFVDRVGGDGFFIRTSILGTTLTNCYARVVGATKAGFRIVNGYATLIGCNGIDTTGGVYSPYWGVFGSSIAQGDSENGTARITFIGNNVEDFGDTGILIKNDSECSFFGNSFLAPATGTVRAVRFLNTAINQTSLWGPGNRIQTKGAAWTNGLPLHFTYVPMVRIGKGSGDFVGGWYEGGGYGTSIPIIMQGEVNVGTTRIRGGLIVTSTDGGGASIKNIFSGSANWTPSIANGAVGSYGPITVTNAIVGDAVFVGFSQVAPAGVLLSGAVTAAGQVTVTARNDSGGAWSPAQGLLRVFVFQHY
jgi:hypothetical protein